MSIQAVEIQDESGNVFLPHTNVEYVKGAAASKTVSGYSCYIQNPLGGQYAASGTFTGSIQITLPDALKNHRFSFWIDVYSYASNTPCSIYVAGDTSDVAGYHWDYPLVRAIGSDTLNRSILLRGGSHLYVYVGTPSDSWRNPIVKVRDLHADVTMDESVAWNIAITTSIQGLQAFEFTSDNMLLTTKKYVDGLTTQNFKSGSWTPAFVSGPSIDSKEGYYVKIGDMCYISAVIRGTSKVVSSNPMIVSGLPFAGKYGRYQTNIQILGTGTSDSSMTEKVTYGSINGNSQIAAKFTDYRTESAWTYYGIFINTSASAPTTLRLSGWYQTV